MMRQKIVPAALVLLAASARCFAGDISFGDRRLQSERLHRILHAKTKKELSDSIRTTATLEKLRLACSAQLRGRKIPSACFEVLDRELHSGLLSRTKAESEQLWLADYCTKRAQASTDRRELKRAAKDTRLPRNCMTVATERSADLHYADESERPDDLFAGRFSGD